MATPKDLLKKQEITFDNHHPSIDLKWDDDLHFHKKITVKNSKGQATAITGVFHVRNKKLGVTYDKGKSHPKIKDQHEKELLRGRIIDEISGIISNNNADAHSFLKRVMDAIDSISRGNAANDVIKRKIEAFDSIMGALGIDHKIKETLKNKNKDLFAFYVCAPSKHQATNLLLNRVHFYNREYKYIDNPDNSIIYYISSTGNKLNIGEYTPFTSFKYRWKGFHISEMSIIENNL